MKVFKNHFHSNHKGVIVVAAETIDDANYLCSHSEETKGFFHHKNPLTFTELKDEKDWWSYELPKYDWEEIADWKFVNEPCILFMECSEKY